MIKPNVTTFFDPDQTFCTRVYLKNIWCNSKFKMQLYKGIGLVVIWVFKFQTKKQSVCMSELTHLVDQMQGQPTTCSVQFVNHSTFVQNYFCAGCKVLKIFTRSAEKVIEISKSVSHIICKQNIVSQKITKALRILLEWTLFDKKHWKKLKMVLLIYNYSNIWSIYF